VQLDLEGSRRLAAIVVGRAGMDLYPVPDGTETEAAAHFAAEIGGSAGNIAVAMCRQGCTAALLGAVSDDAVGRFVRRHLERLGVETAHFHPVPGIFRTSLAICETRPEDSETVFYRNGAADLQLRVEDVESAPIADATFLILTGTALASEPSRAAAWHALALARHAGTFSILDIDHRPVSWSSPHEARRVLSEAAAYCDATVGNEEEFAVMAPGEDALARAASLVREGGRRLVIVKRGRAGSLTMTAAGTIETKSLDIQAKKPFGAGDAFLGSLAAALHRQLELEEALRRAAAAAAYVVMRRGCAFAMPTAAELDEFMADHPANRGA
jgi:5-dehydro-2-deoxygluconokinase